MSNIIEETKAIRQKEIDEGKHAWTVPPLYVVYDILISVAPHDSGYQISTSLFDYSDEFIRAGDEGHEIPAEENKDNGWGWYRPLAVKDPEYDEPRQYGPVLRKGYHDSFQTGCFTREAAEAFIERERHNLKRPRIYVHAIPDRNVELVEIGKILGDVRR